MSDGRAGVPTGSTRTGTRRAASAAKLMVAWVALLWIIEGIDQLAGNPLDDYGITAREPDGLSGILAAPFLHIGWDHLVANSLPLLVLGFLTALGGIGRFLAVSAVIIVASGFGVWLLSPPHTLTVGASGLVFGLFGYLLVRGFVERNPVSITVGMLIALYWGGSFVMGLSPTAGISWQAHLFGLLAGIAAAVLIRAPGAGRPAR
ncbi:rhomboid family intramembrane serine protease [Streptomyces sp. NPDC006879]|uniref:rhomboid family intramembrane serine protease n=1 Tax=Streptomyces sp. NPDC006879 TaxID=3364767 RepID=UPI00368E77AB